jgi:hypothetical protein
MKKDYVLIVEDRNKEADVAKKIAESLNLETKLVTEYSSALSLITYDKPIAIASDLFFPAGSMDQTPFINEVLPKYIDHLKTFRKITDGPLVNVLQQVFEKPSEMSKEEFFDEFLMKHFLKDWDDEGVEAVRDAYFGIQFYTKYTKLQKHIQEIAEGRGLPYGILVSREAEKLNIPIQIVTSTNHHDVSFEPVRRLIGNYTDNIVDGHKDWKYAFNSLIAKLK